MQKLLGEGFAEKAVQYFDHTDRIFPSRLNPGIGYAAELHRGSAWVILSIRMEEKECTKRIFDLLKVDREEIERSVDAGPAPDWHWFRHDNYQMFSSICIRRDGSIDDPPEKLEQTRAWMLDLLPKLKEVFDQRLAEVLDSR